MLPLGLVLFCLSCVRSVVVSGSMSYTDNNIKCNKKNLRERKEAKCRIGILI